MVHGGLIWLPALVTQILDLVTQVDPVTTLLYTFHIWAKNFEYITVAHNKEGDLGGEDSGIGHEGK
jgi:hypothetical protein